jgi:hypothetical protein
VQGARELGEMMSTFDRLKSRSFSPDKVRRKVILKTYSNTQKGQNWDRVTLRMDIGLYHFKNVLDSTSYLLPLAS